MRTTLACLAVIATSSVASADKKLQDLMPNFIKEAAACQVEARGLARIVTGTTEYVATLSGTEKEAGDKDLAAVNTTNAQVTLWCSDLDGIVEFLTTNKDAAYKAVAKDLDVRYKAVAKHRKEAKKALVDLEPVTRRLIPKIKRPAVAAPEEKPAPTAFPSGRSVVLPRLVGTWAVSGTGISDTATYSDKNMNASTTSRTFDEGDCGKELANLSSRKTETGIVDLEPPPNAKELGVAWSVRLATRDKPPHALLVMCVPTKTGGVTVTSDIAPATNKVLAAEMTKLMVDMLSAQLAPTLGCIQMSDESPTTTAADLPAATQPKPSLKQRLKVVMEDYPKVALYTYLALSLTAIIGFTLAIGLGFRPSDSSGVLGTIIAGWAAAKLTLPIRAIATVALTPVIAAFLARRGQKPAK